MMPNWQRERKLNLTIGNLLCRGAKVQARFVDPLSGASQPICVDCGESFEHTAFEIAARRGTGMPVSPRCPACRIARREERNARVMESLRTGDMRQVQPRAVGPSDGGERLYAAI